MGVIELRREPRILTPVAVVGREEFVDSSLE
jgi:hypothetical protein